VPSLVADRRVEDNSAEAHILEEAEAKVEATTSFDVSGPKRIVCPTCNAELSLDEAATHDHLQPAGATR
jgi:hypothetical protein